MIYLFATVGVFAIVFFIAVGVSAAFRNDEKKVNKVNKQEENNEQN